MAPCSRLRSSLHSPLHLRSSFLSVGFQVAFAFLLFGPSASLAEEEGVELPVIDVEGKRQPAPALSVTRVEPDAADLAVVDTASVLLGEPGAAVVRNGPQTGIVQLRGLANERVRVRVDGMAITPACPNHMDPPLHFLQPADLELMDVLPGVTPVSQGGDSIAGSVTAVSRRPKFAEGEAFVPTFDSHFLYRGAEDGIDTGLALGAANDRTSFGYRGQAMQGGNTQFSGGKIRDSGYESRDHSLRLRRAIEKGAVDLDVGFFDGDFAGTPALPMDIVKDEAIRANLALERRFDFGTVNARVYRHSIDHRMDNFSLRPSGMMQMFSPAETEDIGASGEVELDRASGLWRLGGELLTNSHDAYQQNAMSGLRQDTFRDTSRIRLGLYAEWERELAETWTLGLGLRSDTVWMDAADVADFYMPSAADAAAFNAADRSFTDANVDATASLRWDILASWSMELSAARKTRSPSTLERYLWTPLAANAGQADGRTYLGNLRLDPEVSHQVNLASLWQWGDVTVQPSVFYNHVDDYIQGSPIARNDNAGLPVLQYTNLEAELYGVDGAVRWTPMDNWNVGGVLSYVRGRNLDLDDDLYRIAPLSTTIDTELTLGRWRHRAEVYVAAEQDEVARTNGEQKSNSYALLHLRTAFEIREGLTLRGGVENLLDNRYADHLSGVNRVTMSDVAVGERLPGAGRFVYVGIEMEM